MANLEGEWLYRNRFNAFPFVEQSTTAIFTPSLSGDVETRFEELVVDANIVVSQSLAQSRELKLTSLDPVTPAVSFQFDDDTTFSPDTITANTSDDGRYITIRFYGVSGGSAEEDLSGVIVINSEAEAYTSSSTVTFPAGEEPSFVSRCIDEQATRVESVALSVGGVLVSLGETGNLVEGSNIRMTVNSDDPRFTLLDQRRSSVRSLFNRILIEAEPGYGTGKNPTSCNTVITNVRTINRKSPQIGDFQVRGSSCYRVERAAGSISSSEFTGSKGEIQLSNDCQACCDCADFVTVLEDIRSLKDQALVISATWQDIRTAFNEILDLWNAKRTCVGSGCFSQLFGYSFTGWLVQVTVWVGNTENCAAAGATVDVEFGNGDYVPTYVPGSGFIYTDTGQYTQVDPTESGGTFTMQDNNAIRGGGYQLFVFAVRMGQSNDRVAGNTVLVTSTINACGEAEEVLSTTTNLIGNVNKS